MGFLSHDDYGAPLGGPSGRRSSAIIKTTAACVYANEQSVLVVSLCFTSEN